MSCKCICETLELHKSNSQIVCVDFWNSYDFLHLAHYAQSGVIRNAIAFSFDSNCNPVIWRPIFSSILCCYQEHASFAGLFFV